jgi:hypothetical protein
VNHHHYHHHHHHELSVSGVTAFSQTHQVQVCSVFSSVVQGLLTPVFCIPESVFVFCFCLQPIGLYVLTEFIWWSFSQIMFERSSFYICISLVLSCTKSPFSQSFLFLRLRSGCCMNVCSRYNLFYSAEAIIVNRCFVAWRQFKTSNYHYAASQQYIYQSGFFPSGFLTKILYASVLSLMLHVPPISSSFIYSS